MKPEGIEICKGGKPQWRIGKKIGSGACATVHQLEDLDGSLTEWAVKIAPLPKKKTKKGSSTEEVNNRMLYHESVIYQNQFQDLRGNIIPMNPGLRGPPVSGEVDGYRFLVLEKMERSLNAVVNELVKSWKTSAPIPFGSIASSLLHCVEEIHRRKHLVIDIKAENFMLSGAPGKGSGLAQKLASRIRLLDLAMVKPWVGITESHRANEGTSAIVGTPIYASINVHQGASPSRRDDIEAIGYVIAELITKLASGNESAELPWSNEKSDDDIGKMKEDQVSDAKSKFYKNLGSPIVIKIMKEYFDTLSEYSYKKTPDYEDLSSLLSKIKIPLPQTSTPKRMSSRKQALTPPLPSSRVTRARTRASTPDDSEEDESPRKMRREGSASVMETEVVAHSRSSFHAYSDDEPMEMDWEPNPDENVAPRQDAKPRAFQGVTIVVEKGPAKGAAMNLIQGQCESIVVGRKPTTKKKDGLFRLTQDDKLDDSHARLELSVARKVVKVFLTDLNSASGTYCDRQRVQKRMGVFRGSSIEIGDSTLVVKTLDVAKPQKRPTRTKSSETTSSLEVEEMITEPSPTRPILKRRGIRLNIVQGPHKGESYELEAGVCESFMLGSRPSGKAAAMITLSRDEDIQPNHVYLEFQQSRGVKSANVVIKSKKGETRINRVAIKSKGAVFINDTLLIGNSAIEFHSL